MKTDPTRRITSMMAQRINQHITNIEFGPMARPHLSIDHAWHAYWKIGDHTATPDEVQAYIYDIGYALPGITTRITIMIDEAKAWEDAQEWPDDPNSIYDV